MAHRLVGWELCELLLDEICHGGDVTAARVPRGDDGVLEARQRVVRLEYFFEKAEGGAGGGDGELWVEGQHDELVDGVALDLLYGLLGVRMPVAHGDVHVRVDASVREGAAQRVGLLLRDAAQRRAAADGAVGFGGLRRAEGGDEAGDEGLQEAEGGGEADDVWVGKEVVQKGLHVVERVGAAEVEQHDAHFAMSDGGVWGCGAHGADFNVRVEAGLVDGRAAELLRHARLEALLARRHLRHKAFVPAQRRECVGKRQRAQPLLRRLAARQQRQRFTSAHGEANGDKGSGAAAATLLATAQGRKTHRKARPCCVVSSRPAIVRCACALQRSPARCTPLQPPPCCAGAAAWCAAVGEAAGWSAPCRRAAHGHETDSLRCSPAAER